MTNLKKSLYKPILLILFFVSFSNAQSILGLHSDNYAGVYSLGYNPAEIVDSRYKVHINLASFNATTSSNYLGLKREAFFGDGQSLFSDLPKTIENISENINFYKVQREGVNNRRIYNEGELSLFPSFMINFGRKVNHAIGFSYKFRYQGAFLGDFADLAVISLMNKSILIKEKDVKTDKSMLQFNTWNEFGLTYGREILNSGTNFISAALTLKLTQGYAGAYAESPNGVFKYDSDQGGWIGKGSLASLNGDVYFAQSKVLSNQGDGFGGISFSNLFSGKIGFGADLGAVWEYRPNLDEHRYELDGFSDYLDPREEKYKLKMGLSLMDLGYVAYNSYKEDNALYSLSVSQRSVSLLIDPISKGVNDNMRLAGISTVLTALSSNIKPKNEGGYNVLLPSKINVYADYRINKSFYANASALVFLPVFPCCMRGLTEFAITPRFEKKFFSAYLPISANLNGNASVGAGFRAGPLVLGMRDVLPFFGKKQIYEANFYVALGIPLFKSIRDKDEDHVSDYYDACKGKKGPWENQGCPPDADEDGISDDLDLCPYTSGSAEMDGCPDTDGDGLSDGSDRCVDEAGPEELGGCPDTDGDGFVDIDDMCPEDPGTEEKYKGCPDTDKDRIHDGIDDCPTILGEERYKGCVDTDKDTVRDIDDKCPELFGKLTYNGCPPAPPVIPEEYRTFDSNSTYLSDNSLSNLDPIVKFMLDNPEYIMTVEGHTDATAAIPYNDRIIGKQRALKIKQYLIRRGVPSGKIATRSFGERKPVADNSTREGRSRNRRVEFKYASKIWDKK